MKTWTWNEARKQNVLNTTWMNLRRADLHNADLCDADLCDANLCGANLCDANLCGADLCDANLCDADLCDANLCDANLCGANLCDAYFGNTKSDNDTHIYSFIGGGSQKRMTTYFVEKNTIWCGCFTGTLEEFTEQVKQTHAHNPRWLMEYNGLIKLFETLKEGV